MEKKTKFLLQMLVTVGLLIFVAYRVEWSGLKEAIGATKWFFLFLTWLLILVGFWLRSLKLKYILKKQNCLISTFKIFTASAVTTLYSLILPGALDTGVKWYILKSHTGKGSSVLSGMFYNQITEIVLMLMLGFCALLVTNPGGGWHIPVISITSLFIVVVLCFLLLNRIIGTRLNAFFCFLLKPLPSKVEAKGLTMLQQLHTFQIAEWRFHFNVAVLTVATIITSILIFVFAAWAANINVPLGVIVWQAVLVYILGRLPISIANLGVREVTLVESLAMYSVPASAAILMSMVVFSNATFMAAIGAVYQLLWVIRPEKHNPIPAKNPR